MGEAATPAIADLYSALGDAAGERPAVFSEFDREYAALRAGCALVDRFPSDLLTVTGADARRFLNGFVTCDLAELAEGATTYGFITSAQGRILADPHLLAVGEGFRLELPPGLGEATREHLLKYRIADRVEVEPESEVVAVTLVGPQAAEVADGAPGTAGSIERVTERRWGADVVSLWLPRAEAVDRIVELTSGAAAAVPAGSAALDAFRIENGAPLFGVDFGPDNLPQETGLDEAVSFTKGCYLGQEIVARVHYRGKASRRLCGLVLEGDEPVSEPLEVLYDDRPVGTLGRAVHSPRHVRVLGLAILHHRAAAGEHVSLGDERRAEVVELPFATP